jgi:hypothetical protein
MLEEKNKIDKKLSELGKKSLIETKFQDHSRTSCQFGGLKINKTEEVLYNVDYGITKESYMFGEKETSICENDRRNLVENPLEYPYCTIGIISCSLNGKSWYGTGT